VFAAMISSRPYRSSNLPFVAMKTVLKLGVQKAFDPRVATAMLKWFGVYPIGSWVLLKDGRLAKVVAVPETKPDRPVLRVLFDDHFRPLSAPVTVASERQAEDVVLSACDPPVRGNERELALMGL
jgi:hypothetical protein